MKIRSAAAQKAQTTQGIIQAGQPDSNAGGELSMRQEFQAVLEKFAGRAIPQANMTQLALSTFDTVASNSQQIKVQERERPDIVSTKADTTLSTKDRHISEQSSEQTNNSDEHSQKNDRHSAPPDNELKSDDAAANDIKTDISADPTAAAVVAKMQSSATVQNVAQAATAEKPLEPEVATEQPIPTTEMPEQTGQPTMAAKTFGADSGKQKPDLANKSPENAGVNAKTEQTPSPNLETALDSSAPTGDGAKQLKAEVPDLTAKIPQARGFAATTFATPGAQDPAALALSAAINSALTQRLVAAATGGGGEQSSSRNPTGLAQQLIKAELSPMQSANGIRSDLRGDLAGKAELAKNAEQTAKQARIQPSKILERVESTLKEAARSRDGKTISLRLDPPELGSVKVDVSIRDGSLHARVTAENSQVAGVIREKAHELQSMLRKLGLTVEKVSVSVHDGMPDNGGDFSRSFSDTGNSRSHNQEKPREFNNFGPGSSFALAEQNPLLASTPEGRRQLEINNGWVA